MVENDFKFIIIFALFLVSLSCCLGQEEPTMFLHFKAWIDGSDYVYIRGNEIWYVHRNYQFPGIWAPNDQVLDPPHPTIINGENWIPDWPDTWGYDDNGQRSLNTFTASENLLSSQENYLSVEVISGREDISVVQNPTAQNDYTAIVLLNDDPAADAAWYEFKLYSASWPEPPESYLSISFEREWITEGATEATDIDYSPYDGNLHVMYAGYEGDRHGQLFEFTPTGQYVDNFGDSRWWDPRHCAIKENGDIYAFTHDHIFIYDHQGTFKEMHGSWGSGNGQFNFPWDITFDTDGNIYTTEVFGARVQKFDSQVNFLLKWGNQGTGESEFDHPFGIAIDSNGNVYVCDHKNTRIQKFNSNGEYLDQWQVRGPFGESNEPGEIVIDKENDLIFVSTKKNIICVYDLQGQLITWFGREGSGEGQFIGPRGMDIDGQGHLYIVDGKNNRIQVFSYNLYQPPIANAGGPYQGEEGSPIQFDASQSYDLDGDVMTYEWDWDGDHIYDETTNTPISEHTWSDDYQGSINLRITDNHEFQNEDSTTIEVNNVPPTATIDSIEMPYSIAFVEDELTFHGSFTDPGADTYIIEWDFGEMATATGTLDPTHDYQANGTYTVTLTVTDDDGGVGMDTLTVRIQTTSDAIDDLTDIVEAMNLQNGIENSLDSKLQNAADALEAANAGQRQDAVKKLEAFINSVEAQQGKKITEEQADYLIAKAQEIINHI